MGPGASGRGLRLCAGALFHCGCEGENAMYYQEIISAIVPSDKEAGKRAQAYIDSLVKPLRSLGKLERIAVKLSSITGEVKNVFPSRCVLVFGADNGIVEEGVASAPQSVTASQMVNFTKGITGVCVFAQEAGADVLVYDVGVKGQLPAAGIVNVKVRMGTANFTKGPAMEREEAVRALETGMRAAFDAGDKYTLLGVGEMGIGNTTTAAAVLSALTGLPPEETSGKGAGLTEEAYRHKLEVIRRGIEKNRPDKNDVLDVLAKVGGLDIAAMAGAFLGAAARRLPVVMDGFISAVAALCAVRICPQAADYLFPSHRSKEKGFAVLERELSLSPFLQLDMGLGEGSGCPIAFTVIDFACVMMGKMATFAEAAIGDEFLDSVRDADF